MTVKTVAKHKFRLVSHTGKNLGTYSSLQEAEKREAQVRFFANLHKSKGGPGSLKAKVRKKSLLRS